MSFVFPLGRISQIDSKKASAFKRKSISFLLEPDIGACANGRGRIIEKVFLNLVFGSVPKLFDEQGTPLPFESGDLCAIFLRMFAVWFM